MLPLFDEPPTFRRDRLASRLQLLASDDVFIGTSSWKYEGWLGQIYTRERYVTRGKFAQKRFEAECLAEYAETFPVVCGDFSFYQFPSPQYWSRLFASAGPRLQFAFKVPEEITVREGEVLHIPSWVPHQAEALEDTFEIDLFSPIRHDWLDGSDKYFHDTPTPTPGEK